VVGPTAIEGVAIAPALQLRDEQRWWKFAFIVTAAKDGDVAYVGSDWNEGVEPFAFGSALRPERVAAACCAGRCFSDRGVYKLGEEVHFKAILRRDTPAGISLDRERRAPYVVVRDSRNKVVDRRTVVMTPWSATEWVHPSAHRWRAGQLPPLSPWKNRSSPGRRRGPFARRDEPDDQESEAAAKSISGTFPRRGISAAGVPCRCEPGGRFRAGRLDAQAVVTPRVICSARPLGNRPVAWTYSKTRCFRRLHR